MRIADSASTAPLDRHHSAVACACLCCPGEARRGSATQPDIVEPAACRQAGGVKLLNNGAWGSHEASEASSGRTRSSTIEPTDAADTRDSQLPGMNGNGIGSKATRSCSWSCALTARRRAATLCVSCRVVRAQRVHLRCPPVRSRYPWAR